MKQSVESSEIKFETLHVDDEFDHYLPPLANDRWANINKFSSKQKLFDEGSIIEKKQEKKQPARLNPRIFSAFKIINSGKAIMKNSSKMKASSPIKPQMKNKFASLIHTIISKNNINKASNNPFIRKWVERLRQKRKAFTQNQIRILGDKSVEAGFEAKTVRIITNSKSLMKFVQRVSYGHVWMALGLSHIGLLAKQSMASSFLGKFIPTIHPEGKMKLTWNIFICLCILYQFFTITIELFFDSDWNEIDSSLKTVTSLISEALKYLILTDIVINIFTGYFHNGGVVMNSAKIFKHYVKTLLVIDILVLIPMFFELDSSNDEMQHTSALYSSKLSIIKLLFVFRLFKLMRTFYYIEKILSNSDRIEGILSLIKLCFKILFTAHLFACLWFFLGDYCSRRALPNWVDKAFGEAPNKDWRSHYMVSLYWSVTTMITVGYGDITPLNTLEIGFVISYEIIGCGLFGYSLSSIGQIFQKLFAKENDLQAKLRVINKFMKRKKIDFGLQSKVRGYLDFILREADGENSEKENQLINKLSHSLKRELLLQANGKILMNCPLLYKNFSKKSIERLTEIMIPMDLAPEDCIFEEGSTDSEQLFFLSKGKIDLYLYCSNSGGDSYLKIKRLQEGDIFGENSFITGNLREMSAVSVGYSKIFLLKKQQFLEVLKEDPFDYERFCLMRDQILLYDDSTQTCVPCPSCNLTAHNLLACPSLKYLPDRSLVVMKYLCRKKSRTKKLKRRQKKGISSLKLTNDLLRIRQKLDDVYDLSQYEEELNEARSQIPEILHIDLRSEGSLRATLIENNQKSPRSGSESRKDTQQEYEKFEKGEEEETKTRQYSPSKGNGSLQSPSQKEPNPLNEAFLEKLSSSIDGCLNKQRRGTKISKEIIKDPSLASIKTLHKLHSQTTYKSKKRLKENAKGPVLFDLSFDRGKNFKFYFPRNNFAEVVYRLRVKLGLSGNSHFETRKKNINIQSFYPHFRYLEEIPFRNSRRFKTANFLNQRSHNSFL